MVVFSLFGPFCSFISRITTRMTLSSVQGCHCPLCIQFFLKMAQTCTKIVLLFIYFFFWQNRMCRFQMVSQWLLLVLASLLSSAHLSAVPQAVQIFQLCSTQRCFGRDPLPVSPQSWARMAGAFVLSVVIKAICKS